MENKKDYMQCFRPEITLKSGLTKEKYEWLKEIGAKEYINPMLYCAGNNWIMSLQYIIDMPLDELKRQAELLK